MVYFHIKINYQKQNAQYFVIVCTAFLKYNEPTQRKIVQLKCHSYTAQIKRMGGNV
mgnify:CR=1 FL=1